MRMILIALAVLVSQQSTYASSNTTVGENAAIQAALDARNQFITALENRDFVGINHDAMDGAIHVLADQIRADHQDEVMANDLLNRWNRTSPYFAEQLAARLANKDLGDHDPLFPWLNDFIKSLATKYGSIIYSLPIVKDIQTLNFAIPVVFNPHGTWQSTTVDNRIEYRKHFIPFADLVTYYASLYACKYALTHYGLGQLKQLCSKVATKLEFYMGRYIAPVASDWIFKQGNRTLQITDEQLHYRSVQDLRAAIQN